MLVAVLLESEFLYRFEFGDGTADSSGRSMLSPAREPTPFPTRSATADRTPRCSRRPTSGRLDSREDYQREVARLLADHILPARWTPR